MNFVDMIMYYGHSNPEKQAIILVDRVVSYRMLASGIRSVETAVIETGLDKRNIVAVRVENQIRHLILASALYRLGIVSVSVTERMDLAKAGVKVDALISDKNQPLPNLGRLIVLGDAWFQRSPRILPFQSLDAGLFVDAQGQFAMLVAGFTTPLNRSLVSSESGRGERQLAPTCSVPRRRE